VTSIIPSNYYVPGTFHKFNYLSAGGALVNVPMTVAIIGTKSSAGTAVAGTVYDLSTASAADSDGLAGKSSEGALMCRHAYAMQQFLGQGPRIKAVFIAEPSGGTANVQTLTFAGTVTAQSDFIVDIAGRLFTVNTTVGQTAATVAASVNAALLAKADTLPVAPTVASAVVSLTHPTKGVNGGDVKVVIKQQATGVTATLATGTAGSGAADIQPALDALAPLRYDAIAIANHAAADITEINTDILTRWSVSSKTWAFYFLFEPGTIGTATALASAANHQSVLIGSFEGCRNAPGEGAVAMAMLAFSRERANAGFDGAVVPLYPPADALLYTPSELNTAIGAGLTPFGAVIAPNGAVTDNRAKVIQMVTTRTTFNSQADDKCRDLAVPRTGVMLALQLDIAYDKAFGPEANPDGVSQEDSKKLTLDLAASILRAEADAKVLNKSKVEADIQACTVVPDDTVVGRNNARLQYHVNNPLHQTGWQHDVLVGGA